MSFNLFSLIPIHEDGDFIVAAGNMLRKKVVDMVYIGYAVVWFGKYIVIPFGGAVLSKLFVEKLLQPHTERQRKTVL